MALEDVRLGDAGAGLATREHLAAAVGDGNVRGDRRSRVLHAAGKSYPDLVRQRAGDAIGAPDAVVFPADHDEVRAVLAICAAEGVAVVPFGGGTSVVGGVAPVRGPFAAADRARSRAASIRSSRSTSDR